MFLAAYESRNFAFEAAGDTAADAIDFLKQALAAHAQEYSLADDWWNPDHWTVENLFSVREVTAGCAYRDGQKTSEPNMQLCRTESPKGVRYYLDGKRISRERADDLKASHDQDTFVTRVSGDTTRQYSSLRKK